VIFDLDFKQKLNACQPEEHSDKFGRNPAIFLEGVNVQTIDGQSERMTVNASSS